MVFRDASFLEGKQEMLITRFNKMIRNKTLWWFFAIIVSVTFVWAYSDMSKSSGGCGEQKLDSAGKLFGKDITASDLRQAMYFTMQMRDYSSLSQEKVQLIRQEAWKRLASLRHAETLGISASEQELTSVLAQDRFFQDENGTFNKRRYMAFLETKRIDEGTFAEYLKEEIILRKVGALLNICSWTSPVELSQRLKKITDRFTIQCATLSEKDNTPAVNITRDEARKYFEKNIEKFRVPEKVNVKYVSFPLTNYLAAVQADEKEVSLYYTNNIEKFTSSEGTNAPAAAPFEKVKQEITDLLKRKKALVVAKDTAARFVETLIPDQKGKAPTFEDAAAKNHLDIMTSEFFPLNEEVPKLKVGLMFNRIAFDLDPQDRERYFSDAIEGENAVYVLAANSREKSFLPDFAGAEKEAVSRAKKIAEYEAFLKKASDARNASLDALKAGKKFETVMKEQGAKVGTNMLFSAYDAPSLPSLNLDANLPKIVSLTKGEVSEPLDVEEGVLIVYVADRQPGDSETMELLKPQLIGAIDNSLATAIYDDWKEYILSKAGFVDHTAATPQKPEPADGPDPTEL